MPMGTLGTRVIRTGFTGIPNARNRHVCEPMPWHGCVEDHGGREWSAPHASDRRRVRSTVCGVVPVQHRNATRVHRVHVRTWNVVAYLAKHVPLHLWHPRYRPIVELRDCVAWLAWLAWNVTNMSLWVIFWWKTSKNSHAQNKQNYPEERKN